MSGTDRAEATRPDDRADVAGLADRAAVVDVCVRYARALDRRDWDLLATCFTPDAVVDFDGMDRIEGAAALVAVCRSVLEPLSVSQHLLGTHHVEVDGDRARSECYLHAQHVRAELAPDDKYVIAGTYVDALVRTADGWRITHRRLAAAWAQGNPAVVAPPETAQRSEQ